MLPCGCADIAVCTHALVPYVAMPPVSDEQPVNLKEWLYDKSPLVACNALNFSHRILFTIRAAVHVYLALRTFDEDEFDKKWGGVTAPFWGSPDTIIFTLVTILVVTCLPLWNMLKPPKEKKDPKKQSLSAIIKEGFSTMGSIGVISYLTRLYETPPVVRYALFVVTSTPFVILIFSVFGIKINSKNVREYSEKLAEWRQSNVAFQAVMLASNTAEGLAALISSMIDYWYDARNPDNLSTETNWVLAGIVIGFFVGAVGGYLKAKRNYTAVATMAETLKWFGSSMLCIINYTMLLLAAHKPTVLIDPGFRAQKNTSDAIIGILTALTVAATGAEIGFPKMWRLPAPHASWSEVQANPQLVWSNLWGYVRGVCGLTVSPEKAEELLLKFKARFQRSPIEDAVDPLRQRLLEGETPV